LRAKVELIALAVSGLAVWYLQSAFPQPRLKDGIVFSFNEEVVSYSADALRLSSFGYGRAASSLLWLRFLQQTPPKKVERDQLSWIYHDLDAISELDPEFYPAYEHGGIFLSVITEDKRGAERIFLKGIKQYPERWRIRAYLAYHYRWELDEPDKAAEQEVAAAELPGAPPILKVAAASAFARMGDRQNALSLLQGLLKGTEDPIAKKRILDKIRKITKEAP
jgi:hypothetical protein